MPITYDDKLEIFADDLFSQQAAATLRSFPELDLEHCRVTVHRGSKYVRVDVGTSGKYMVDAEGHIFGIKAYGRIHLGHQYGTLDTIDEWDWGGYLAIHRPRR